jgi:MtrB/PioB family decaheme-associated outer membrane protein
MTTGTGRIQAAALAGLASAAFAALPSAWAQDADEVAALTKPSSSVEVGIGVVSDDNLRWGRYSGLNEEGAYGLLGIDLNRRDDATGTWFKLRGRNLGLDSRDIRLDYERQGQWGYSLEFSQTPRHIPYVFNTTLTGIETGVQTEGGTAARDVQLSTRRDALGLGYKRSLGGGWSTTVQYRHEEKTGTRNWGHNSVRFLVDPIDYTTQQLEATLAYADKRLQLTGGYYGTDFSNALTNVHTPVGGGTTPIALPPANQSHQLYLSGGYGFTPTTRGMFKVAFGRITQDQTFFLDNVTPFPGGIPSNLDGRIDTTLIQFGVSSRPLPKLTLRGNLRYDERDDRTPLVQYSTPAATSTHDGHNEPRSFKTTAGKIEASYMLPANFRLTGGAEHDIRERNTSVVRAVSFRDETKETTLRAELRRALSETLNGALSFATSERTGSDWLTNVVNNGTVGSNLIHPLHLADRDRNKVRLMLDWMPLEPLSIHFVGETAEDEYSGRALGPRSGEAQLVSVDAAYRLSDEWQATAWTAHTDTSADQVTCESATPVGVCPNTAADPIWDARLRNVGTAYGLGLRGKVTSRIDLEAELSHSKDRGEFDQTARVGALPVNAIPDVTYKVTTLKLKGSYALNKASGLRLLYIYDRLKTDDWYWTVFPTGTTFAYADGTTVTQDPDQKVHFLGVSYYYRFQ